MRLFSRILGNGEPLLILHGLFGMSDNWLTIAKELAVEGFAVHLPDLRNHGKSPHTDTHRYTDMVDDLLDYLAVHGLDRCHIVGHSMGGKLAMIFSLLHPEHVTKLVVVDIAPSDYRQSGDTFHHDLINTLLSINLREYNERGSIRQLLEKRLGDKRLAAFFAKNIGRDEQNGLVWKFNLPVLQRYLNHIRIGLHELEMYAPCPVSTLFIKGNDSEYYLPAHEPDRRFFFPNSVVQGIDNAGHWVHAEQTEIFLSILLRFLGQRQ